MKQQEYRSSSQDDYDHYLRAVQQPSKIAKKPLPLAGGASSGAPQPKVYKVKPIHFRELVQQLTGARAQPQQQHQQQHQQQQPRPPQARARRSNLHAVAPPPLRNLPPVDPHQRQLFNQSETTSNLEEQVQCKVEEKDFISFDNKVHNNNNNNGVGTTELVLSPNFQAWFSFAMMSPKPATVSQV